MFKRFSKYTPVDRGRIRVTVEYDAVVLRELGINFKDAIKWFTTSPERDEIIKGALTTFNLIKD